MTNRVLSGRGMIFASMLIYSLYMDFKEYTQYFQMDAQNKFADDCSFLCVGAYARPISANITRKSDRIPFRANGAFFTLPDHTGREYSFLEFRVPGKLRRMFRRSSRRNQKKHYGAILPKQGLSELSRTTVIAMSSHTSGPKLRVLYVMGNVVAGKAFNRVNDERYTASIKLDLIRWNHDLYSIQIVHGRNEPTRFVIGDDRHGGLRVCQASSVLDCFETDPVTNVTVVSPMFKLMHLPCANAPVFTYHLGMAFQFGSSVRYLQIADDTGESILTTNFGSITKFMLLLGLKIP